MATGFTTQLSRLLDGDKFMEVREHPERGRYVISKRNLSAGQVIMKDTPYAVAIFDSMKQVVCDSCLVSATSPLKCMCEKCKRVWYCSPKCKLNAKSYHQHECVILEKLYPSTVSKKQLVDLKLVVRILATRCVELAKGPAHIFETVSELLPNTELMTLEAQNQILSLANCLLDMDPKHSLKIFHDITIDDMVKLLGIIQCNNFALKNFGIDKHYFGQGTFLKASLFNHSCVPNLTVKISKGHIEFLTMEAISAGTELNITYTDTSSPSRGKHLEETYLFSCRCAKCELEQ